MTIKKTISVKRPTVAAEPQSPAAGGAEVHSAAAAVADRYRLDASDAPKKKGGGGGAGTTAAVVAGVIALVVAGILTFVMYQHWEFLKGA